MSLNPQPSKSASSFKKKQGVSESWEDEELEDSGDETDRPLSAQQSADYPSAPPPTPISPSTSFARDTFVNPYGYTEGISDSRAERNTRPEKTDAVARRMIAGALGEVICRTCMVEMVAKHRGVNAELGHGGG